LFRLGKTNAADYKVLSNGPVKSAFRLRYNGWQVNGSSYDLEEKISIQASKRWYLNEIKVINQQQQDTLITGIVNLKDNSSKYFYQDGWHCLYSHGKQSENDDFLGMAILIPDEHFVQPTEKSYPSTDISDTHLVFLKPHDGQYQYIFYAGWQGEDERFADRAYFEQQLKNEINNRRQKIKISK
ncbi:MAG: DUF4861 family protein, partial [Bacteroidota bacterium]